MPEVLIRSFEPGGELAFRALNEEWISHYFKIEAKDLESFADPQTKILGNGGEILFAVLDGRAVGCCALVPIAADEFEVAKMAVSSGYQGAGIGRKMMEAVVACARDLGARRLYLETNELLKPAIRLYEAAGFRHLDPERVTPSPYARANVFMELVLHRDEAEDAELRSDRR